MDIEEQKSIQADLNLINYEQIELPSSDFLEFCKQNPQQIANSQQRTNVIKKLQTASYELQYCASFAKCLLNEGFPDSNFQMIDLLSIARNLGLSRAGPYENRISDQIAATIGGDNEIVREMERIAAEEQRRNIFKVMDAGADVRGKLKELNGK